MPPPNELTSSGRQGEYRSKLRSIGAYLDSSGYHACVIVEVEDGLMVRASRSDSRYPDSLEFANGEPVPPVNEPAQPPPRHPLFSGGYEQFLDRLGERLDRWSATSISIVEATDFVAVSGFTPVVDEEHDAAYEAMDLLLLKEDIAYLMSQELPGVKSRPDDDNQGLADPEPGQLDIDATERSGITGRLAVATSPLIRLFSSVRPQITNSRG